MYDKEIPLLPRNGHILVVGIGARISGCANQKEMSLDDQVDHGKEVAAEMYEGPIDFHVIATTGKGEALDRPELEQIENTLRKGELDILIFEDLGRLVRGGAATRLLGIGKDHGTRTIVPNDCIDTAEDNWEQDALTACAEHVGHNAHTSKRLKFKLMNRFTKFGGATARPPYGYLIPSVAKTYDEWTKDPAATPKIQEGARLLKKTLNCSAVADWFNREGVPTGPYCRRKAWDGKMVRRFYANTILKGLALRGTRKTVKHHETGRRVSVKNAKGPKCRECPHLAHLDPMEFDELNALLKDHNKDFKRKLANGVDPRHHVPKKRTRFPGQFGRCWYCGHQHVWGGNGVTENLMCSASREWKCWNSFGYNGALAVERLMKAITDELYRLDGFDEQFRQLVEQASRNTDSGTAQRLEKLKKDEAALAAEKQNVQAAIAQFGPKPFIQDMLTALETNERALARERHQLQTLQGRTLELPRSVADLRQKLEAELRTVAVDSLEFGPLMRQLVPEFSVYLVRLCDGGHLLPRAKVKLALDGIVPDACHVAGLSDLLQRDLTLDLFEPTQRERIRSQAVVLAAGGLGPKAIAEQIEEKPTATAVQRALALDRKMRELSFTTPYEVVLRPPDDYPKLRHHKNPKYRFTPLDGYQPPAM